MTKRCELDTDWLNWSDEKRSDRLFMSCPSCGAYGSHVGSQRGLRIGRLLMEARRKCQSPSGCENVATRFDRVFLCMAHFQPRTVRDLVARQLAGLEPTR